VAGGGDPSNTMHYNTLELTSGAWQKIVRGDIRWSAALRPSPTLFPGLLGPLPPTASSPGDIIQMPELSAACSAFCDSATQDKGKPAFDASVGHGCFLTFSLFGASAIGVPPKSLGQPDRTQRLSKRRRYQGCARRHLAWSR